MKGDGETASGEDSGLEVEVVRGQAIHINPTILDNIIANISGNNGFTPALWIQ